MRNLRLILIGLIIFCSLATSCNSITNRKRQANIVTGKKIELAEQAITTAGGKLIINEPSNALNGLTVEVPANAFSETENFHISVSEIKKFECGPYFHPITPAIVISNGGGYSDSLMSVTIPLHVPAGKFAMAFLYNDKTGELEAMPFAEESEDHIKVVTKNFSNTESNTAGSLAAQATGNTDVALSEIVVSVIDTTQLKENFLTPFKPGADDWQFVNWGSFVTPGGHCSGQVMGMLWYYHNKKLRGQPPLYGKFDNDGIMKTPGLWQDDVAAYRFCSMLQLDWSYSDENTNITAWQKDDTKTFWAFAYAMRVTNEPQLCIIGTWDDKQRHAILVYGISDGNLLVDDPNKPGSDKPHIYFDASSGTFAPYFTGLTAGDAGMQWPKIYYYAKSAVASWRSAETHWNELLSKTIGEDKFPNFTVTALNDQDEFVPLTDGFMVPLGGNLTLRVKCPGVETDYSVFNEGGFKYSRDGDIISLPEADRQMIGICVTDTTKAKHWIGFKWFTVKVAKTDTTTEEPKGGKLHLTMRMDGINQQIDSASFNTDLDLTIRAAGPRDTVGNYAYPYTLNLHTRAWHGLGSYILDNGGEGSWFWYAGKATFSMDEKEPGRINITAWKNGHLSGSYGFTVVNASGERKFIDGEFHN